MLGGRGNSLALCSKCPVWCLDVLTLVLEELILLFAQNTLASTNCHSIHGGLQMDWSYSFLRMIHLPLAPSQKCPMQWWLHSISAQYCSRIVLLPASCNTLFSTYPSAHQCNDSWWWGNRLAVNQSPSRVKLSHVCLNLSPCHVKSSVSQLKILFHGRFLLAAEVYSCTCAYLLILKLHPCFCNLYEL